MNREKQLPNKGMKEWMPYRNVCDGIFDEAKVLDVLCGCIGCSVSVIGDLWIVSCVVGAANWNCDWLSMDLSMDPVGSQEDFNSNSCSMEGLHSLRRIMESNPPSPIYGNANMNMQIASSQNIINMNENAQDVTSVPSTLRQDGMLVLQQQQQQCYSVRRGYVGISRQNIPIKSSPSPEDSYINNTWVNIWIKCIDISTKHHRMHRWNCNYHSHNKHQHQQQHQ